MKNAKLFAIVYGIALAGMSFAFWRIWTHDQAPSDEALTLTEGVALAKDGELSGGAGITGGCMVDTTTRYTGAPPGGGKPTISGFWGVGCRTSANADVSYTQAANQARLSTCELYADDSHSCGSVSVDPGRSVGTNPWGAQQGNGATVSQCVCVPSGKSVDVVITDLGSNQNVRSIVSGVLYTGGPSTRTGKDISAPFTLVKSVKPSIALGLRARLEAEGAKVEFR